MKVEALDPTSLTSVMLDLGKQITTLLLSKVSNGEPRLDRMANIWTSGLHTTHSDENLITLG